MYAPPGHRSARHVLASTGWQRLDCSYKDSAEYANVEKSLSACLHKHRMEC